MTRCSATSSRNGVQDGGVSGTAGSDAGFPIRASPELFVGGTKTKSSFQSYFQIFAICAFATTTNFEVKVGLQCTNKTMDMSAVIDYPFAYSQQICKSDGAGETPVYISGDLSSDSQFFVATGVLSMLYCIFIIAVYGFFDKMYKDKQEFPMADFMLTTILAIFWLSGSAAWSNGTSALKGMTDIDLKVHCSAAYSGCTYHRSGFSSLNISLVSDWHLSWSESKC